VVLDSSYAENKRRLLGYGSREVRVLYERVEAFAASLSPSVTHWANPKSYIGFYTDGSRGSQFLQAKVQKRGLRIVLVAENTWFDPQKWLQLDGGRSDRAYQNALLKSDVDLPYAFMLIAQAYGKKLGQW